MTRKSKPTLSRSHEAATVESFRKDPTFAAEYLNAALTEGDQDEVLLALRRLSLAFGGLPKIAKAAELNATTLYRTLSPQGNPEMKSLIALLRALGLQLAVRPLPHKRAAMRFRVEPAVAQPAPHRSGRDRLSHPVPR
jgi:probable addiction module antidote protein